MSDSSKPTFSPSALAVLATDMNLLRCFRGTGIATIVTSSDPSNVLVRSRHCRRYVRTADPASLPEQFTEDLISIGRDRGERPVLYYSGDAALLAISRHRDALAPFYRFLLPPNELVEDLVDKTRFARLATDLGIAAPLTITGSDLTGAEDVLARVSLPCLFKPSSRHLGWDHSTLLKDAGGEPQKVLIAHTATDVMRLYERVTQFTDRFVIQPYIQGGDDCIYSFHAYFDRHGESLAHFVGRKIRTYPRQNGVSTYLELVKAPEVVEIGLDVARRMAFVGAIKIDLKKDSTSGRLFVLEVNPRYTLWNHLGTACGINLPLVAYAEQTDQRVTQPLDYRTGIRWLSFGNDVRTFLRSYRPAGELSATKWLASLSSRKVYDIFALDDPLPFVATVWRYVKLLIATRIGRLKAVGAGRRGTAVSAHGAIAKGASK